MTRRILVTFLAVAAATVGLGAPARGVATFTPTRFDDPAPGSCDANDCSLREAILAANASVGVADTIQLAAGTYQLSILGTNEDGGMDGDLDVTNDALTITGKGPAQTNIDAGAGATGERALDVFSELTLTGATVRNSVTTSATGRAGLYGQPGSTLTLTNVTVTGHVNNSTDGTAFGSGINSDGTLTLTDVVSTENTAPNHCCSGVFHYSPGMSGSLTARNVTVTNNTDSTNASPANTCCSGLYSDSEGPRVLENITSSGNRSDKNCCAGMYLTGNGTATLSDITILNNTAGAEGTSGLFTNSPTQLSRATVSGNSAPGDCCAGIYVTGSLVGRNLTVSGNTADACCSGITIDAGGASLSVNNATVTANTANADNTGGGEDGAGLVQDDPLDELVVGNTIASGNTVGTGSLGTDCFGTVMSQGYNLIGNTADCTFTPGPGDIVGADPKLGPLSDNGGTTMTHALGRGSPAINNGNPAIGRGGPACETTDQRGLPRKDCDIGAYERVVCAKVPVNRIGTEEKDKLGGTKGSDGMLGFGGKDTLNGKGGKDALCGGKGKDTLKGGGGKDVLRGEQGKDTCVGGPGKDKAKCEEERKI